MEFTNAKEQKQSPYYDAAAVMSRLYHQVHMLMFGFVQKTSGCLDLNMDFEPMLFPKTGS